MLGFLKKRSSRTLNQKLAETDARLALLKVELAAKMVKLAGQTDDLAPLKQAEDALSTARNYYTFENTPIEVSLVQVALGDMLMKLGKEKSDKSAMGRAREAYRAAVTLASLHGDDELRDDLRNKIKLAESLTGHRREIQSLFRVA